MVSPTLTDRPADASAYTASPYQQRVAGTPRVREIRGSKAPGLRVQPSSPFGHWLADQLEARGWGVEEFCAQAHIAYGTVYKMLRYAEPTPQPGTVLEIARVFDVPVAALYGLLGYLDDASTEIFSAGGLPGPRGTRGPVGPRGFPGAAGPQGERGERGRRGH